MKTETYHIRLTEAERKELKKRAKKLGLTEAAYIRMKTLYEPEEKKGKKWPHMARLKQNRDRNLTEKVMGGCWHEWREEPSSRFQSESNLCKKCGGSRFAVNYIDFSTWLGFGQLWEQLRQRKYWRDFWNWLTQKYTWDEWEGKNPSQRADVIFEFLKEMPKYPH